MNNLKGIITDGGYAFLMFVFFLFTKQFKLFYKRGLFMLENFYNVFEIRLCFMFRHLENISFMEYQ
jgi:hypothetical protein